MLLALARFLRVAVSVSVTVAVITSVVFPSRIFKSDTDAVETFILTVSFPKPVMPVDA